MTGDRPRAEEPDVVSSVAGIVVAVVSAVFGICAHGLAAGTGVAFPESEQLLLLLGASAGVGAVTAALARRHSPVLLSAAGLLAGQGLVHLVLASGHSHGSAGHGSANGHSAAGGHAAGHMADPGAVRAAMDGAGAGGAGTGSASGAGTAGAGHADALMTPEMLGGHLGAIVLTLVVVSVLSGTLAWVAARTAPALLVGHLLVVVEKTSPQGRTPAPDARYLLSGGGTRGPPVGV